MELDTADPAVTYTLPIGAERVLVGRCKDCKFWHKSIDFVWGRCEHPRFGRKEYDDVPVDYYRIETGPEFGCIHFEQKD